MEYDKIKIIHSLIINSSSQSYIENGRQLTFSIGDNDDSVKNILNKSNIDYTEYEKGKLSVELKEVCKDCLFYINLFELQSQFSSIIRDGKLYKNIVIFDYKGELFTYEIENYSTKIGNKEITDNYIIENLISTYELIEYLRKPPMVDYFNSALNESVFYSSTKGILKLHFPYDIPLLDDHFSIKPIIQSLIKKCENDQYKIHFINTLFDVEKAGNQTHFFSILNNITTLLQSADNNFQLALKNFSFDKLKSDLQKEKEKYFSSLREILNKIISQIVGVPVSIGASIFASYKVDDKFVLLIILIAFIAYISFAIYFQVLYRNDVKEIEKDFNKEFDKISNDSGLPEANIGNDKSKIERRFKVIYCTIRAFIIMVIILGLMFLGFIIKQLFGAKPSPLINSYQEIKVNVICNSTKDSMSSHTYKIETKIKK